MPLLAVVVILSVQGYSNISGKLYSELQSLFAKLVIRICFHYVHVQIPPDWLYRPHIMQYPSGYFKDYRYHDFSNQEFSYFLTIDTRQ